MIPSVKMNPSLLALVLNALIHTILPLGTVMDIPMDPTIPEDDRKYMI